MTPHRRLRLLVLFAALGGCVPTQRAIRGQSRGAETWSWRMSATEGRWSSDRAHAGTRPAAAGEEVAAPADGWLMLRQLYDPAWRVTVDGTRLEPLQANRMSMAIPISKGDHDVRWEYRPASRRLYWPVAILLEAAVAVFLLSAAFIAGTRVPEAAPEARGARAGVLTEITEGFHTVIHDRVLRALAGASATTILFGRMFMAVYVLYMTRDLGLGAMGIGLVFATGGVGSFAGSVVAEPLARRFGPGPTMIGAQVAFGLTGMMVPLAVLVPSWALAMIVASEFAQWMAILIYWVVAISVRQAIVPDRVLGRVSATMRFLAGGAHPIGAVIGGALGGVIGVPLTLVVASFGMLLGFLWPLLSPVRGLSVMPTIGHSGSSPTAEPAGSQSRR